MPVLGELFKVGPDGDTARLLRSPEGMQTGAAVAGGTVVARSSDQVQARRLADGELLWKAPSGAANYGSTPAIGRSTVFFGVEGQGLSAVDLETGAPRWATPVPDQISTPSPVVLPGGDVVYGGGGVGRYDGATGQVAWQDTELHLVAPPAYADGVVFGAGLSPGTEPVFAALDAATGRRLWQHEMTDPPFFLAPAVGGGVVVSVDGRVVHAYDVRTGDELWSLAMSRSPGGAPVIADGHVFLTEAGNGRDLDDEAFRVSAHDLRTGRFLMAWEPGAMPVAPVPDVGGAPGGPLLVPTTLDLAVVELR
jgi:outer membrane protein assembly factor BamB